MSLFPFPPNGDRNTEQWTEEEKKEEEEMKKNGQEVKGATGTDEKVTEHEERLKDVRGDRGGNKEDDKGTDDDEDGQTSQRNVTWWNDGPLKKTDGVREQRLMGNEMREREEDVWDSEAC